MSLIRQLLLSLIITLGLGASNACGGSEKSPASPSAGRPRIVALGDSLTSGHGLGSNEAYPAVLQRRIMAEGFDFLVVNAGVSGDTSSGGLQRLEEVLSGNVRILILALGANDGLRGIAVSEVKRNLAEIITAAEQRGINVLLCGMEAPPIGGLSYTLAFHNMYRDLAADHRVSLVPFLLRGVFGNRQLTQADGIHPNAVGARMMADNVWPYLKPMLQVQATVSLQQKLADFVYSWSGR